MEQEKRIHRRLVGGTQPLVDELLKLEFEEQDSIGHGIHKTRVFKKDFKYVKTGQEGVTLYLQEKPGTRPTIVHQGLTVHDEMLIFFANRNTVKVDEEPDNVQSQQQ